MKTIFILLLSMITTLSFSQKKDITGSWTGNLKLNIPMRLVFHIKDSTGGFFATMDSPDQNAFGIPCDTVILENDSIHIKLKKIGGSFDAVSIIRNDSLVLQGNWKQSGMQFPMQLHKTTANVQAYPRPQNPKAPFPYSVEDVIYKNDDGSVVLGGTITMPLEAKNVPAVILISGSGQQDRNEEIFGHKPFWIIADYLSRNGIAVLRVDDRGTGKSTGDLSKATSEDFALDVMTSLDFLKTRKGIDINNIGLIGHSEGGMIAPIVASKRKEIAFMVLLAAPAVQGKDVLLEQQSLIMQSNGLSTSVTNEFRQASERVMDIVIAADSKETAVAQATEALNKWMSTASAEALSRFNTQTSGDLKNYIIKTIDGLYIPWYRYFLKYDPVEILMKSSCPTLAIFGEKDIQVVAVQNFKPMKDILSKSRKASQYKVLELKGINHMFQHCSSCNINEYPQIPETFTEEALIQIVNWIKKLPKGNSPSGK